MQPLMVSARACGWLRMTLTCGMLAGCQPLQYVPKAAFTGGYSHTQLAPDQFDVRYDGSGRFDEERITDYVLWRGAELCQRAGFAYFEPHYLPNTMVPVTKNRLAVVMSSGTGYLRAHCFQQRTDAESHRLETAYLIQAMRAKYP